MMYAVRVAAGWDEWEQAQGRADGLATGGAGQAAELDGERHHAALSEMVRAVSAPQTEWLDAHGFSAVVALEGIGDELTFYFGCARVAWLFKQEFASGAEGEPSNRDAPR